jgi:purine-nucleoside/S-methyl-5'-thioadenosine phosphorylase / adenosine deaminase
MNWIRSENLSKIRGVVHGFSNRNFNGSVSDVARFFGLSKIATLNQIHSSVVFVIKDGFKEEPEQKGDAIVTSLRGIGIGVFTADCVPLLLIDKSVSAVAVVHAGWRGTLSQITKATLLEMEKNFGTEPSTVSAVVGPSIGMCCYEVGKDVAALFKDKFANWDTYLFRKNDSKYVLDLKEANRTALVKEGVENIEVIKICTKCSNEFHSYRRDGKRVGNQLSFIGLI